MQPLFDYLAKHEARFIRELCEYVTFPSVSAQARHAGDLKACGRWLEAHCRRLGLETRLHPTDGNPILVAKTRRRAGSRKPHFLVYGHYDVQPPEPIELWKTPPFKPTQKGRNLFGRGASDNKGQNLAHLKAVEAYIKTGTPLPCDITFLIEGEEEVGSKSLAGFLKRHRKKLACDAVVISDTGIPSLQHPALTYGLRGIAALEVRVDGPSRDLHSGIYGGSVDNPAMVLCEMLGRMRDGQGRITIPGFYDEVAPLTAFERRQLARLPFNEAAYRRFLGVAALKGESGFTPVEQRCARPTFEINGLTSGYQGQGSKTIVPAWASAKVTMRLVPRQEPGTILRAAAAWLRKIAPPTVRVTVQAGHGGDPYVVSPEGALAKAGLRALEQAFGHPPYLMREGGSIPIVNDFKRILKAETLLLGLALPDDNLHSPNEKFNLDCFTRGMRMSAVLWQELSRAVTR
jgi:acetylornithine deacetylase/succinyl-diaminopimelate desuccinylase-like protein